jgi:hypothetical protein
LQAAVVVVMTAQVEVAQVVCVAQLLQQVVVEHLKKHWQF